MFDRFVKKLIIFHHITNRLFPSHNRMPLDAILIHPSEAAGSFLLVQPHSVENYHSFVRRLAQLIRDLPHTGADYLVLYLDRFDPLSSAVWGWLELNAKVEETWRDTRFSELAIRGKYG